MHHNEHQQTVRIKDRDFWIRIVDQEHQHWALIERMPSGAYRVYFLSDASDVFDEMDFLDWVSATEHLEENEFGLLKDHPHLQDLAHPEPFYFRSAHPNGRIYSSGRSSRSSLD